MQQSRTPWLACRCPRPRAKLRMFCFPFGGGGTSVFYAWPDHLPAQVEVVAVQLPGRESRLSEPSYRSVARLVEDVGPEIVWCDHRRLVLFGHSMGSLVVFELARLLRAKYATTPAALFVSGRRAPQLPPTRPPIHKLPDDEFLDELRRLNGTPQDLLDHEELMQLMMPTLRADFELVETYRHTPDSPLSCPMIAFGGMDDPDVSEEELAAWREQTTGRFSMHRLPGDHFFLRTAQPALLQIIRQELTRLMGEV